MMKRFFQDPLTVRHVLRSTSIRAVALAAVLALLAFPLIDKLVVYPRFEKLLIEGVVEDSTRVAARLGALAGLSGGEWSREVVTKGLASRLGLVEGVLQVEALKVFSPSGEVLYSTAPGEAGGVQPEASWAEITSSGGGVLSRVVRRSTEAPSGRVVATYVVETYVPILHEGSPLGTLAMSVDVTDRLHELDALVARCLAVFFLLALGLAALAAATSVKAARAEGALRKLSRAFGQSPNGVVITDAEGTVEYVNPTFARARGFGAEEVLGRKVWMLDDGGLAAEIYGQMAGAAAKGREWRGELSTSTGEGEPTWESASVSPVRGPDGTITHFLVVEEDIARRKRAEEEVRRSRDDFDAVANSISDGLMVIEDDYTVSYANEAMARQMGMEKERMIGQVCYCVKRGNEHRCETPACPVDELRRTKLPQVAVHQHVGEGGAVKWMELSLSPIFDEQGRVVRVVELLRDVTERRRSEEALSRAHDELRQAYETLGRAQASAVATEKLAALGRLTAGVSHEILNPLNIITLRLFMIKNRSGLPAGVLEELKVLEEQAARIAKIAQDLLYFSRQRTPERCRLDLNETVRRTVALVGHDLRLQNVSVEMELADGLPPLWADQDQLQQVVLNLVSNARDVMPEGGRLRMRTAAVASNGHRFVELRIEDTGGGIPPENLGKLFDPFFTTKPEGEGTGLGLSICQGIVEAHGGAIWAENLQECGAAFVVRLGLEPD